MKKSPLTMGFMLVLFTCLLGGDIQNISPATAYQMTKNASTYLIDVRSIAEYYLVGHPEMAVNIPWAFWNEKEQKFVENENFIDDIKRWFKNDDTLIFMCRSGGRSLRAAGAAQRAGFSRVFNIEEGFEGEPNEKGYRTVGGWKNSGLSYTYKISQENIYHFK
jgi:rhodanese-related sulfurtransferase